MTLIIPEGYAQFTLQFDAPNLRTGGMVWTFGMGEPLGAFPTPLVVAAQNVADAYESEIAAGMDSNVTLTGVQCDGAVESAFVSADVIGTNNIDNPPPNVALLVRKITSIRGRRAQGRLFVYGMLLEGDVDERGRFGAANLAAVQDRFSDFLSTIVTANSAPMVILQNSEGISPPIDPPPEVTSLDVQELVASQRRRLR